jgi:hypothetical protein
MQANPKFWAGRIGLGVLTLGLAGNLSARPDLLSATGSCTLTPASPPSPAISATG